MNARKLAWDSAMARLREGGPGVRRDRYWLTMVAAAALAGHPVAQKLVAMMELVDGAMPAARRYVSNEVSRHRKVRSPASPFPSVVYVRGLP